MVLKKTLTIEGCLKPIRVVNIAQYFKSEALGGLTMQVQVPLPQGSCFEELPPTDVYVAITSAGNTGDKRYIKGAEEIIKCLSIEN